MMTKEEANNLAAKLEEAAKALRTVSEALTLLEDVPEWVLGGVAVPAPKPAQEQEVRPLEEEQGPVVKPKFCFSARVRGELRRLPVGKTFRTTEVMPWVRDRRKVSMVLGNICAGRADGPPIRRVSKGIYERVAD